MGQQQQKWYEISDLSVTEILAQQVGVSESCLLFYKRREELEEAGVALHKHFRDTGGVAEVAVDLKRLVRVEEVAIQAAAFH
jgi:hypothetical protein